MNNIILGIDVGSTKICSIIAELKDDLSVQIIGTGLNKSQGVKKGAIVNIEQASRSIKKSVDDAKRMAGININKATISLSGSATKSYCTFGSVAVTGVGTNDADGIKVVDLNTIKRALEFSRHNASIPNDYEVIHILPYRFVLDEQDFIEDPIGMAGSLLKVYVHIVTVLKSSFENLKKSVKLAGVSIGNVVLSSYAASISVLHEDEKDLGVACIDMGANTCELMIYEGNSMQYNDFIGAGSSNIAFDIATLLNTSIQVAEEIKIKYGDLIPTQDSFKDEIEIPSTGDPKDFHRASLGKVYEVVASRVAEILSYLSLSIDNSKLRSSLSGVVLTGGMSNLAGMKDFASAIFSPLSVRIAKPMEVGGLFDSLKEPSSTVAVGLILYSAGKFTNYEIDMDNNIKTKYDTLNMVESKNQNLSVSKDNLMTKDIDLNEQGKALQGIDLSNLTDEAQEIKQMQQEMKKNSGLKNWITKLF